MCFFQQLCYHLSWYLSRIGLYCIWSPITVSSQYRPNLLSLTPSVYWPWLDSWHSLSINIIRWRRRQGAAPGGAEFTWIASVCSPEIDKKLYFHNIFCVLIVQATLFSPLFETSNLSCNACWRAKGKSKKSASFSPAMIWTVILSLMPSVGPQV